MTGRGWASRREDFIVRIRRRDSEAPAGVGFVVAEDRVLTCAHVVNTAMGRDQRAQEPPDADARIELDFPVLGQGLDAPLRRARVEAWVPPPPVGIAGGDIAGLVVGGEVLPEAVKPARLAEASPTAVHVFGFPSDPPRPQGGWVPCQLQGTVGGGMLQLDADSRAAFRAQPGYSGAAVWDEQSRAVVGMLNAAARGSDALDAYAVPTARLVEAWEVLAELTVPPSPYRGLAAFGPEHATCSWVASRRSPAC